MKIDVNKIYEKYKNAKKKYIFNYSKIALIETDGLEERSTSLWLLISNDEWLYAENDKHYVPPNSTKINKEEFKKYLYGAKFYRMGWIK